MHKNVIVLMNGPKISISVIDFERKHDAKVIFLSQAKQLNLHKNISVSFVEKY